MPFLSVSPNSKPNRRFWHIGVLLCIWALNSHAEIVLTVPHKVSLSADTSTQQLSISWFGGESNTFDILVLRTEFNETVFYDTVSATMNQISGHHEWKWTSVEPLECTSLSIKIRSRDGKKTSEWSEIQILQGKDIPGNGGLQMYPQDRIVLVGTNTTFCCIVEEGKVFVGMTYSSTAMEVKRLSRRSYATTAVNQGPSRFWGTNVICRAKSAANPVNGAVIFVGYPPQPTNFTCETHDLISAVCSWNIGKDTHLYGKGRQTLYSVNKRNCSVDKALDCIFPHWDGNWTLVAVNPLGQYSLTDSAEISHRVSPVAPVNLNSAVQAFNATLVWKWEYDGYSSLPLVCQVELTTDGHKTKRVFSGVGLHSVVLLDLQSDEDYSVRVRCGAQQNFWKWGKWSDQFHFKTKTYVPDAPDVWVFMNGDNTGLILWKPLTRQQSHGQITGFEVTLWNLEENVQHTEILPAETHSLPVNLAQMTSLSNGSKVIASVMAKNVEGFSEPASVPLHFIGVEPHSLSRVVYTDSGFPLFWQQSANSTCSYVVEWHNVSCSQDCPVDWIRVAAGITNVSIESVNFQPGVRYNFSLYSCPSDSPQLLQRWQGYVQELVPSSSVPLSVSQQDSDVILTWGEIPLADRRGFLLGYNVYINNGSQLALLANLTDVGKRTYTMKGLSGGSYKFTVKAYTSAGEDTGTAAYITVESYTDGLILEMLASLGIVVILLVIVIIVCYKKRKWVKRAFYPDIPEPKLPSDWSRTQGPLNVKPSPHSMVHIVEKPERDSSKEALVVIFEEEEDDQGQRIGDEPVDTDEPQSLRYYDQVVDERPIRPRFPDSSVSSAFSLDSASTDVTYTGIQTSGSSLVFQLDPPGSSEIHQPQMDRAVSSGHGAGGYRPQTHRMALNDDMGFASSEPLLEPEAANGGGYKPQCSWHLDSPTEASERGCLAPSLGSPISVASTQFLLPDGEEHAQEKGQLSSAATWFTNLLSSTKP
ncbi:LIF receptor subunit alpha a isoform 1-T2 [Menidia menidia]